MSARRRSRLALWVGGLASVGFLGAVALMGTLMAILGGNLACLTPGGTAVASPPTRLAVKEIPSRRLRLYQQAARRFGVDWAFLASIGYQECGHGACAHVYPSGCGGPMQIAIVRESACSPGPGPTIWERYKVDADGSGADPFDPADAIFTAARMMRPVFGLQGDSYAAYHQVACNYYGACSDGVADYAKEVMKRALRYGFGGSGASALATPLGAAMTPQGEPGCGGSALAFGSGPMGPVRKLTMPRHLAPLPASVSAVSGIECDARIVPDVVYLARRFGILVTACFAASGHEADGEHPLGAAIDAGPRDGDWYRTMKLALAIGWRASCAPSGVAPRCARPPFRFVGYNGYPGHGDPLHCVPCPGGPHIHLSWLTSASEGQPENRPRYSYEPARWIEAFEVAAGDGSSRHRREPGSPLKPTGARPRRGA